MVYLGNSVNKSKSSIKDKLPSDYTLLSSISFRQSMALKAFQLSLCYIWPLSKVVDAIFMSYFEIIKCIILAVGSMIYKSSLTKYAQNSLTS